MYPSLPNLIRVCTKPYTIPGTNVLIEKGTPVIIPIYAIHRDPLYYSDPDRFDPERFTDYNKEKRPPYTYLPFGEGPRICIGTVGPPLCSVVFCVLCATLGHAHGK
jgi:cytochrome P450 family 6